MKEQVQARAGAAAAGFGNAKTDAANARAYTAVAYDANAAQSNIIARRVNTAAEGALESLLR